MRLEARHGKKATQGWKSATANTMNCNGTPWCHAHFITPGRPIENNSIESFHGRFCEEYLNEHWSLTLDDARLTIEYGRIDYNQVRPHSLRCHPSVSPLVTRIGQPWLRADVPFL